MKSIKIIASFITLISAFACSMKGMHIFDDGLKTHRRSHISVPVDGPGKHDWSKLAAYRLRTQKNSLKQEDLLFNYSVLMQELKAKTASRNPAPKPAPSKTVYLTQTEAHLKIYKDIVDKYLMHHPDVVYDIPAIIEQEKLHDETHYVFYHTQIIRLSVMQDFLKELYQLFSLAKLSDFVFLRNPHEANEKEDPNAIAQDIKTGFFLDDHNVNLRKKLLSVNLAFFGNINDSGESTYHYFNGNRNINPPALRETFRRVFSFLKIDPKYLDEIEKMLQDLRLMQENAVVLQIFVPKEKVDKCVYLSLAFGKPYPNEIVASCYDYKKGHHTRIAPILDYYKEHPEKIADLDKLQARITLSRDIMLNPESGVKIRRYGTVDQYKNNTYKARMREIAGEVARDMLKANKITPINPLAGKMPLQRLMEYRAKL